MRRIKTIAFLMCSLIWASVSLAGAGGGNSIPIQPDGIFSITPVLDQSCVAVKISINAVQALAGIRWYNNDDQVPFAKLLVASGQDAVPPLYADGVVVAEEVLGERTGWSEVTFTEAYGSQTNALYVLFQFPEDIEGAAEADGPGIGYRAGDESSCIFLSAEGDDWVRLQAGFSLLVEPIFVDREPGVMALAMSHPVEGEAESQLLPAVTELSKPYPNPFNPMTTIKFSLAKQGPVDIRVFDLRGRLVKLLAQGSQDAGEYVVKWMGDDSGGSRVASGVYFVRMETEENLISRRVVLLK